MLFPCSKYLDATGLGFKSVSAMFFYISLNMAVHFESCKHGHLFQQSTLTVDRKLHWNTLLTRNIGSGTRSFFSATVNLSYLDLDQQHLCLPVLMYSWLASHKLCFRFQTWTWITTALPTEVLRFLRSSGFWPRKETPGMSSSAHLKSYGVHHSKRTP